MFIPIVCVCRKIGGCAEVATIFLKKIFSWSYIPVVNRKLRRKRKTFVLSIVPSRTAEVIGLKGTLKWTQGEESFYFVYYSILVLLCLPNKEISRGMWKMTSNLFIPFPP